MLYSRLGVCCLVSLESVAQVVLVVHVTLGAQVIVKAHFALPPHSHDAMLLAAVADDVGVAHTWRGRTGSSRKVRIYSTVFWCKEKKIPQDLSRLVSQDANTVLLRIFYM